MGQISHEPSMEDILASIKRIIAEDSESVGARPPRPRREMATAANEAGPSIAKRIAARPAPVAVDEPSGFEEESEPLDVLELTSAMVPDPHAVAAAEDDLMSDPALQASRNAFAALAQRPTPRAEPAASPMEAFVAEMLKPMLKEWLDRELPGIVERLVAAEIQKVSGRS